MSHQKVSDHRVSHQRARGPRPAGKNRLAQETSPYLQQHADNPVDWYPWGEEALALARETGKPILLSIGYSACHWCHVMAHESFEDPDVAAAMNEGFVNIKVDREERPDIDQIYQLAHQMFNQRGGGWPLTVFLTPDQAPFFVGTYFPKESRYQLPGFVELLQRISAFYRDRRHEIDQQNEAVLAAFSRMEASATRDPAAISAEPIALAVRALLESVDSRNGGFGGAPKFPHPTDLELLLRVAATDGNESALHAAVLTLEKMAEGGIYDQLGGGFCRYSVDATWTIPHFEKMLYDNGPLLRLYADAWAFTGKPLFKRVVEETATWLEREMHSPEGGYYSTLDADSEGHEGKYYVWIPAEAQALLDAGEYAVAAAHYGLEGPANFEGTHWNLRVTRELPTVAERLGRSLETCEELLAAARRKLFAARERRVRPGRDEKILASWNALAIQGMARAAAVFDRPDWLASARRSLEFVRKTLWRDGTLLATYKDGRAHLNAYSDDYAFLIAALVELLQTDFRVDELAFARTLADALLERFEDAENGGFFFTSHDHEKLIHRPKPGFDNATPSGNGVAAQALTRLGHVTGDTRYLRAAERTIAAFWPSIVQHPAGFASMLGALAETVAPTRIAVLRGDRDALAPWLRGLAAGYRPDTVVLGVPGDAEGIPEVLAKPLGRGVNAFICQGVTCSAPVTDLDLTRRLLMPARIQ
jgi:uncharacterized protein YyaL (SSP411 family)